MSDTSSNKAVGARVPGKVIRSDTIDSSSTSRHHSDSLGASTAREKGSVGPVQGRLECATLYNMRGRRPPHRVADLIKPGSEANNNIF